MFLGHFAVGLGAKKAAPAVSLGTYFIAAQLADLIWPNLVLLGIERVEIAPAATAVTPLNFVHYPYSHSLLGLIVWGSLFALAHFAVKRSLRSALVLGAVVMSHWVLDWAVHAPDMPLTFTGATRLGVGLWNSPPVTALLEVGLLATGALLYARATRPRDAAGKWGLWALTVVLLAIFAANLLGPPPPSATAVAWAAQAMWLLVLVGYWVDRHRVTAVQEP